MDQRWMWVSLIVWAALVVPAAAQGSEDDEARGLFEAGRAAFDGGRYEEALMHFERAHELSGRSALLFNIGHTAERLRRDDEAIDAFERFLEANPESSQREAIERRLEILREHRDDPEPEPEVVTEPEVVPPSRPVGAYVLLGAGGAAMAGGAISVGLAVSSASAVNDAQPGTPWSEVADDERAARRRRRAAGIVGAIGVASVVGGLVWLVTSKSGPDIAVGPGHVELRGRF